MKKMIMKKSLLFLLLALTTSVPMLATDYDDQGNLLINENNFPDPAFREYLLTNRSDDLDYEITEGLLPHNLGWRNNVGMAGKGDDGKLTPEEIQSTRFMTLEGLDITNLQGLEYFTNLFELAFNDCPNLTSLDLPSLPNLGSLIMQRTLALHSLDVSNCPHLKVLLVSQSRNIEQLNINTELEYLEIIRGNLTNLDLPNNSAMRVLYIARNENLVQVDVSKCTALDYLGVSYCNLPSIDLSKNTALKYLNLYRNNLTELDVSQNTALKGLNVSYNQLKSLDLSNNRELLSLNCRNNHLTELDLSGLATLEDFGVSYNIDVIYSDNCTFFYPTIGISFSVLTSPQNLSKDYVAINGRSKLGIQCNSNNGDLNSYGTYSAVTSTDDNNNYIVVGNGTTDVHGYDATNEDGGYKVVNYDYETGGFKRSGAIRYSDGDCNDEDYVSGDTTVVEPLLPMTVNIQTAAHGMYVHPETMRGSDNFYSGTLYLEFPAKIPDGVRCYYATGLDDNEDLVGLTEVTGTIPANTAVIVKAPTEYKFFAFNKSDETPDAPTNNIIEGTIEGLSVTPGTVLTLGHNVDRSTGEYDYFGFWNYRGNWINPFRAYIPKSSLAAGAKNGFSLFFPEYGATGIARMANSNAAEEGAWYTLSGIRISGKPATKGIYVNKGQKVVIR